MWLNHYLTISQVVDNLQDCEVKTLDNMEQIVQDHEKRIQQLEKSYDEVKKEITGIHTAQYRMETTILRESQEQKELIRKVLEHQFGLDKINLENKWKLWITVLSSGSVIGTIVYFILREVFK